MTPVNLGSIAFINSLPVDYAFREGRIDAPSGVFETAVPAVLNRRLAEGTLDISPVSSLHYAENADKYLLLPDLSVSSRSGVKSVLLFSRVPAEKLSGRSVAVTPQGKTTPALLRLLMEGRFKARPRYETAAFSWPAFARGSHDAFLVIGDEALRASHTRPAPEIFTYDLAEEWQAWTGHPFVFAVWVVRRDFYKASPAVTEEALRAYYRSREWGRLHLAEIVWEAARRTGLPEGVLSAYFEGLEFRLDKELLAGLEHYFDRAYRHGLLPRSLKPDSKRNFIHAGRLTV